MMWLLFIIRWRLRTYSYFDLDLQKHERLFENVFTAREELDFQWLFAAMVLDKYFMQQILFL